MAKRVKCAVGAVIVFLSAARVAAAQEIVFKLDPRRSQVEFTLGATLHTVHGQLAFKQGTVRFNRATGHSEGVLVVDATTANTGNTGRDNKMHRQILESQKYPEIIFRPQQVR